MSEKIEQYDYSRLYIFIEDDNKKILKRLKRDDLLDVDDYQYKIVTSVSQRNVDGKKLHLLQYEDKQLGWIELERSIQIFRFPVKQFQVIEGVFQPDDLNEKMGISKDFIAHFQGKILNIKSQITYADEVYYSVFLKNKFHGFHKEKYLDPFIEQNINIEPENVPGELDLYKFSNLTNEETENIDIEKMKITGLFKQNKVAKLQINSSLNYWVAIEQLPGFTTSIENNKMIDSDLYFDDLIQSIENERAKTKEILKSVLSAQEFASNKKGNTGSSSIHNQIIIEEMNEELTRYKKDNRDLAKQIDSLYKENKLAEQRLAHQLDYKARLEEQRNKYKDRMNIVEEKMKNLDSKYKELKSNKKRK